MAWLAAHGDIDLSTFAWWELATLAVCTLFVMWTIWRAVVLTLHPGEEDPAHIKRLILRDPTSLQVNVSSGLGGRSAAAGAPRKEG